MALKPAENSTRPSRWSAKDPWAEGKTTPGAFPPSPQPEEDLEFLGQQSLAAAVRARRHEYIRKKNIKIKVGTWNVAAISSTYKDLAAWFLQGLGVKGLHQNLAGLSVADDSDYSSDDGIESVEHQESRSDRRQSTVPAGEVAQIPSDDNIGLYVLGLQEIVDISSITEAMRPYYDPKPAKKWKRAVNKGLPPGYVMIADQQLLGLYVLVYAAPNVASEISAVSCTSVGTGALGYVGNKGAVSVRIVLGGTTRLLFVNCHLAAGADQSALTRRIWDTGQILSRTRFEAAALDGEAGADSQEAIGDEDFAFWFGDLNYRLDGIPGEDVRRLLLLHTRNEYDVLNNSRRKIDSELGYVDAPSSVPPSSGNSEENPNKNEDSAMYSSAEPPLDPRNDPASVITTINSLLQHDQLRAQQRLGKAFHEGWREGEINFLPTYKYDVGSVGMFDSGEKKRSPSWCDRILYRTRQDRLRYQEKIAQQETARKRDEEMKAKGLDTADIEQEVLFDYDPATDGADDYDEYADADDHDTAPPSPVEERVTESIALEQYISHQRVLSSDHKPLSAIFNLQYDAVIPELKAQVQNEVARIFDKNENDARPAVTLVVDKAPEGHTNTDMSTGASELNSVEFGNVRYHVPVTRTLTVANTGPINATIAFIDRPVGPGGEQAAFPSWMTIEVHHDSTATPKNKDDLGSSTRFVLSPGDIAIVDITIDIKEEDLVYALNESAAKLDDILVLRVLDGRDHFVSVKGSWMPSSFYRYLDELVRYPKGVRSFSSLAVDSSNHSHKSSATTYHSAPKELFELTEALPGLVERAMADWTMTNKDKVPPWNSNLLWPFQNQVSNQNPHIRNSQLSALREALDTAKPISESFDADILPLEKAELLADTLVSFLASLKDGIIPSTEWQLIGEKVTQLEKSRRSDLQVGVQEIVMDALSVIPVHSVSLTFVNFLLSRLISELSSYERDGMSQSTADSSQRSRSATDASQAPSETSVTSIESTSTRSSILPSFSRRRTEQQSSTHSASTKLSDLQSKKMRYLEAYSEFWANIIIRSEHDSQAKNKDKKAIDARKRRVLIALLDSPSM